MPRALLTGITGQDGSYLAELLLEKGYEVHGVVRPDTDLELSRINHLRSESESSKRQFFLHSGSLEDPASLRRILAETQPDELYHLAAQTHVGQSLDSVEATCELAGMGTLRLLEMIRHAAHRPRFFHASSSEIFGRPDVVPQDEQTPMRPVTPYGCAKAFATNLVGVYRQAFGLFAVNGILYNHESPRRGVNFVTQKICRAAAAIKAGTQNELLLGNLDTRRDWGDARDYVRGMWLALNHSAPEDFVFSTGEVHSVQEVLDIAFEAVELHWRKYVKQDPRFFRREEPARLIGNPAKAQRLLDWRAKTSFKQLITEMTLSHTDLKQQAR